MDDQIVAAMQSAAQGVYPPEGGMGTPAQPPPPPLPPAAAAAVPPAPSPGAGVAPSAQLVPAPEAPEPGAPELETDNPEEVDDELGSGARPRQSGTTVRTGQHPIDRAAKTISSEIHDTAARLSQDLFPSGPAGSERLSKPAFDAYVLRHWDEAEFRQSLLNRMAPKGPDGKRLNSGVKQFNKLYTDVVESKRTVKEQPAAPAFVPPGQATPQVAPPLPPPPPGAMPFQPPTPPAPPMPPMSPPPSGGSEAGGVPPPGPNVLPPG